MKPLKAVIYTITALVIFAQGLYFSEQWLVGLLVVAVLLVVVVWRQESMTLSKDPVLLFLVVNLCLRLIGYAYFVEKGMLIFGVLKACFYLLFYLLLMQLRDEAIIGLIKKAFVVVMAISGGIASVLYCTGWLPSLAYIIDDRLAGPLQYANAYGILLVAAVMIVLTMEMKTLYRGLAILLLTVPVLLTMSRGVYLIGCVMVGVMLVTSKARKATYGALLTSIVIGAVLVTVFDQSDTAIRLTETTSSSEWHSRLLYYKDAITMIRENPLGYGTNGYHYAQSFFQTGSTYHVKYVHSSLIQSFLDIGLVGGLVTGLFMAWSVFLHKMDLNTRLIVLTVLGHSLMDMDLQFPAVWLLLLVLIYRRRPDERVVNVKTWPVVIGLISIMTMSIWLLTAVSAFNQGDYTKAIGRYEGYTEAYRQLLNNKQMEDQQVPYAQTLVDHNPYITELYPVLIDFDLSEMNYDKAVQYAKDYVNYSPLLIDHHVTYAETLTHAATHYLANGDQEQAATYAKAMLLVPGNLAKLAKEKNTDYNVNHKPDLTMNDALMDAYIEAGYIMEKIENGR